MTVTWIVAVKNKTFLILIVQHFGELIMVEKSVCLVVLWFFRKLLPVLFWSFAFCASFCFALPIFVLLPQLGLFASPWFLYFFYHLSGCVNGHSLSTGCMLPVEFSDVGLLFCSLAFRLGLSFASDWGPPPVVSYMFCDLPLKNWWLTDISESDIIIYIRYNITQNLNAEQAEQVQWFHLCCLNFMKAVLKWGVKFWD